jgi:hypothetical protein
MGKVNFKKKLVQGTKDYDVLNLLSFNRPCGIREDLAESIRKNGFTDEIKVVKTSAIEGKSKLYIVDGQNRYFTARSMNLPIDYIIEKETQDLDEIARMVITYNSVQKPWRLDDYVNLHIHFQNQNYITLKRVCSKFGCSVRTGATLLKGQITPPNPSELKDGSLKVTHLEQTEDILTLINDFKKVRQISNRFILGFVSYYLNCKDYNHKKFIQSLEKYNDLLIKCRHTHDFRDVFNTF